MFGESPGQRVAGLPGRPVDESNLIVLQLRLHDLGSPGCRVAGLLSRRVKIYSASALLRLHDLGSPGCRVAGSPSQIFQYNARLHINAKVA